MKKFFTTIKNIFSIEELRKRILYTLLLLLVFRLGSYVVLPGVDPNQLGKATGILGMLDIFLGGAFSRASIFALGIMPYISASIIVQLLQAAVPSFQKMQKEGESGRKRLTQITRILTIFITIAQSSAYLASTIPAEAILFNASLFRITSAIILTTGTMFCMWLGEKITDRGIGNGISMLIMIGIVSRLPQALYQEVVTNKLVFVIIELLFLFFIVITVVMLTQAVRKIPVQYAKQVVGKKVYGGQRQYIPLKINAAGVMPIIFAQALMFLPSMLGGLFFKDNAGATNLLQSLSDYRSWQYNLIFGILIILFTFFYTAIMVNPKQIADDMKRNGGFIPGIKPGEPTSEYIDDVLTKITFPGSVYLAIVAIFPAFAVLLGVTDSFSQFYGGTSLLIMVGVVLDTLQQIESYLLMRHYEGLMKSGDVKGRNIAVA